MFSSGEFNQTFEPKQGFIRFLLRRAKFVDEISLGFGPLGRPIIGSGRRRRPDQLAADNLKFIGARQCAGIPDDIKSKQFGPSLEVLHGVQRWTERLSPLPSPLTPHFTVLTSGVRPWMRTSSRSPDSIGPTPLGVPVTITSPGSSVMLVETKLTIW
jgi:hypothetical protein